MSDDPGGEIYDTSAFMGRSGHPHTDAMITIKTLVTSPEKTFQASCTRP